MAALFPGSQVRVTPSTWPSCQFLFFCQPRVVGQPLPLLSLHLLALPKKSHPFWVTLENCATAALWLKFPPLSFEYTFP